VKINPIEGYNFVHIEIKISGRLPKPFFPLKAARKAVRRQRFTKLKNKLKKTIVPRTPRTTRHL